MRLDCANDTVDSGPVVPQTTALLAPDPQTEDDEVILLKGVFNKKFDDLKFINSQIRSIRQHLPDELRALKPILSLSGERKIMSYFYKQS